MVMNRPEKTQPTLVVCMVALLSQWSQEIELKTNLGLKCLIYHGDIFQLPDEVARDTDARHGPQAIAKSSARRTCRDTMSC